MNRTGLFFGAAFGFLLASVRFTDYDVIHNMLLLRDWHPFLTFGSALAVAVPLLRLLQRRGWRTPLGGPLKLSPSPVGRHHIIGSALFGTGWAVAGTCPGPALAMVGSGRLLGVFVVAGLFCGIALRDVVVARSAAQATLRRAEPAAVGL